MLYVLGLYYRKVGIIRNMLGFIRERSVYC